MSTQNICFCGEIRKIFCGYPLLSVAIKNSLKSIFFFFFFSESKNSITCELSARQMIHMKSHIFSEKKKKIVSFAQVVVSVLKINLQLCPNHTAVS